MTQKYFESLIDFDSMESLSRFISGPEIQANSHAKLKKIRIGVEFVLMG